MSLTIKLLLFICYFVLIKGTSVTDWFLFENDCTQQVYRKCTHRTSFTTKEIQTAQLYLQRRFGVTNPIRQKCPIRPDMPPCIRKDIKCLTPTERTKLTNAWLQLYSNGYIGNITKVHNDYWGAEHKFMDGPRWHFWFINQLEKELQKIDPSICMPYWNTAQDFANPELSVVFDIFGRSGTQANDYCVHDGPFAGVKCTFPNKHCIRRQWRHKPKLDPWKGPEYYTMAMQKYSDQSLVQVSQAMIARQMTPEMSATYGNLLKYASIIQNPYLGSYSQLIFFEALVAHFDTHLSIGGYNGDMSIPLAPCDPLFHIFHIAIELYELLWQLSNFDDIYLVPKSFNGYLRYDNITATLRFADIDTDRFNYYTNVYVNESFQFGYGEMCHLYDIIIEPINQIVEKNLRFESRYPNVDISGCVPDVPLSIWEILWDILFPTTTATLPKRLLRPCNPGPLPTAAQRIKNALNSTLFEKYYPKFAFNNWTRFDHYFGDVSSYCNPPSNQCRKMPLALPWNATLEGQRQYQAFTAAVADFDLTPVTDAGEVYYETYMNYMNNFGYCSPYVTE